MRPIHAGGIRRLMLVAATCTLSMLMSGATVLADTEAGETGLVGPHDLRDALTLPGVTCVYKPAGAENVPYSLVRVRVSPPSVRARDLTPGTDRQRTGWRFIVERDSHFDTSSWEVDRRSGTQKAFASDVASAPFTAMSVAIPLQTEPANYRVKVKMFWYRNGRTEGTSTHIVDFYAWKTPDGTDNHGPSGDCIDGLGN